MHLPDGAVGITQAATWGAATGGLLILSVSSFRKEAKDIPGIKGILGLFTAAAFIISILHFPIPVIGSSAHMVGTALIAIIIGPKLLPILILISLFIQALFFSHGGVTTLGANTFATWFGGFIGWLIFYLGYKMNLRNSSLIFVISAWLAGFFGNLLVYGISSTQIALADVHEAAFTTTWITAAAAYAPTQVPLAVVEGILTVGVLKFLISRRPQIFEHLNSLTVIDASKHMD